MFKVKLFEKMPMFEQFTSDIKMYLETISKVKYTPDIYIPLIYIYIIYGNLKMLTSKLTGFI